MLTQDRSTGPAAGLVLLAVVGAAAFSLSGERRGQGALTVIEREQFFPMSVKPAGVVIEREDDEFEMGPPPPGEIRITGEPVPDWRPGYQDRNNPMVWTFVGPRPMSSEYWSGEANAGGRVVSIAPHPTNSSICYIASASGGIWKTTNAGSTWSPMTDELSVLNHGCVALDPTNASIVYAGTGEYTQDSTGDGLFKSTDAGATWSRIATSAQIGPTCSGLAVSPVSGQTIHATSSAGYHRTTNGGTTWSTLIAANCSALRLHPSDGQVVYVGRRGQGLYKSVNGGTNFARLNGGLPASGTFDRIVMDISRSNPLVLYAAFISGSNLSGLYKTIDGGTTWSRLASAPNFCQPQCWYDAYVGVNPMDENVVFCGGVDQRYATAGIVRSLDGGVTWAEMSTASSRVHPDHHAIAWGPTGTIWEGNDGGVWKSTNGGTVWQNLNSTLAAAQLYHVALHPTSPERILGGTQDNGTPERTAASVNWPQLQAGDGGFSAFDFTNTSIRYTTYVYLTLYRWNSFNATDISGPWDADPTNWVAPFVIDPNSSTTLVAGTNRVWRTTNSTSTAPAWTPLSDTSVSQGGTLNAIAVARGAGNTIYVGNSNGGVYATTNGTTWNNRSTGLPRTAVSTIVIDPSNPARAYVANYGGSGGRVYRTTNTGQTWTSVTGALPAGVAGRALAVDFVYDPPVMYVGGGSGVYVSFDDGASWIKDDASLPNATMSSLAINTSNRTIVVGTYGRGAWRSPLAVPPRCVADFNNDGGVDGVDVEAFYHAWEAADSSADVNLDGGVDGSDVEAFYAAWEAGC